METNDQKKRERFRKTETLGVIAVFLLAILTGYFYVKGRLEKAEDNQVQQHQIDVSAGNEGSDAVSE